MVENIQDQERIDANNVAEHNRIIGKLNEVIDAVNAGGSGGGGGGAVDSVNGKTGTVVLDKADVGLGSADDTADLDKPVSTAQQAAIDAAVAGLTKASVGLGNVDDTADADKPVSTAQQAAIDAAVAGAGGAVDSVNGKTGVVVLDKADVGLGNVDNTSDMDKPVSTAQQAAIDAVAGGGAGNGIEWLNVNTGGFADPNQIIYPSNSKEGGRLVYAVPMADYKGKLGFATMNNAPQIDSKVIGNLLYLNYPLWQHTSLVYEAALGIYSWDKIVKISSDATSTLYKLPIYITVGGADASNVMGYSCLPESDYGYKYNQGSPGATVAGGATYQLSTLEFSGPAWVGGQDKDGTEIRPATLEYMQKIRPLSVAFYAWEVKSSFGRLLGDIYMDIPGGLPAKPTVAQDKLKIRFMIYPNSAAVAGSAR